MSKVLILQGSPRANGNTAWMAEEYKASPIYYFTLSAQIQAPIQRFYSLMKPANVKKIALLLSSHSPGVYDAAIAEYKLIAGFCGYEDIGVVTAKLDEQKTDETKQKVIELVNKL